MKLYFLAAFVILAPFAWLLCALALRRWRGRQLARWMREREGQEFTDPDCRPRVNNKRLLAVKWEAEP